MCTSVKRARRFQSTAELNRLADDVKNWHAARRDADTVNGTYRGQYDSQLNAVVTEVTRAAAALGERLDFDVTALSTAQAYARLARLDRQIIWLRRAWDFFRAKFDQRDDPRLGPALAAADEVVWSCYRPFFDRAGISRPPAPLPYIEFDYLPSAVLPSQGHVIERLSDVEQGPLAGYFTSLPLPVLRLPPAVVTAPWTLALVAHEVGHLIMPLLNRGGAPFLNAFRDTLSQAVARAGGNADDTKKWVRWAPEVFADFFAVLMVGPWAEWSIGQYELTDDAQMRVPKTFYPAPDVRLFLLAEIARVQRLPPLGAAAGAGDPAPSLERRIASEIATATRDAIPGFADSLATLVAFRRSDFTDDAHAPAFVSTWAGALRAGAAGDPPRQVRHARLLAAATARAWKEMSEVAGEEDQRREMRAICDRAYAWIAASGEVETRAASTARELKPAGKDLSARLLEATDDQLFGDVRAAG